MARRKAADDAGNEGGEKGSSRARNMALDHDLVEMIEVARGKLAEQIGFEPTYSQTLKHMLRKATSEAA
jgi:hypothetical protein